MKRLAMLVFLIGTTLVFGLVHTASADDRPDAQAIIHIDDTPAGQLQTIDGFGTTHRSELAWQMWYSQQYYDDLGASIVRIDLTPHFKQPWSSLHYYSPWFMGSGTKSVFNLEDKANPNGPENNRVRTYSSPGDYSRPFGGKQAPIPVMTDDIDKNQQYFDFSKARLFKNLIQAGEKRQKNDGDFKLVGSIWSPAPWVKEANGQIWKGGKWPLPVDDVPYPFIWNGNFAGGRLDTSDKPLAVFDDGTGPTSALTQFARTTAAYIKGLQDEYGVRFYAISIQNELNFPEFYNSCVYRTSEEYIKALKAVRHEFDRYPDLKPIRIMGPEDLLGGGVWSLWQFGGGDTATHKNLRYLQNIAEDPQALAALDFFCIHGYASDGATAAGADSQFWRWWAHGWDAPPAQGLPAHVKGFMDYGKKSWMTETSGESNQWISPASGFPGNGAWSIAFRTQQALTAGRQSAILYWQFIDKADQTTRESLTQQISLVKQPKYVAAKHFFKYVRPGATALLTTTSGSQDVTASAYWHPQDKQFTIVLVNRSAQAQTVDCIIPARVEQTVLHSYTSDAQSLWQPSTIQTDADRNAFISIPGYGVVTLSTYQN